MIGPMQALIVLISLVLLAVAALSLGVDSRVVELEPASRSWWPARARNEASPVPAGRRAGGVLQRRRLGVLQPARPRDHEDRTAA